MKNNFDRIAPIYDVLASFVFGNKLEQVQKHFLGQLGVNSSVLIVGGGTGKILEWLPSEKELSVTFVEMSSKMMEKAKSRKSVARHTEFIQSDLMDYEGKFDYVIANFFLDCFSQESLGHVLDKLADLLNADGKLMVSDFCINGNQKDKIMTWWMHRFFRLTANLESQNLKDIRAIILTSDFVETEFETFDRGQLFAGVYSRGLIQ